MATKDRHTSKRIGTEASKEMRDKSIPKRERSVAASAESQRAGAKDVKKKKR